MEDVAAAMAKLKAQRPPGEPVLDANGFAAGGRFVAGGFVAGGDFGTSGLSQMMPGPPPSAPPPQRYNECTLVDVEEVEMSDASEQHDAQHDAQRDDGEGGDQVYAALLIACRDEGYDKDHVARKKLVTILAAVHEDGADFPANIMDRVVEKTKLSQVKAHALLKPQVVKVLTAMREAVQKEEERLAELRLVEERLAAAQAEAVRLAAEAAAKAEAAAVAEAAAAAEAAVAAKAEHQRVQEQYKKEALIREKIRQMALCPAGFDWHREEGGWRCNGGSHFLSNAELR